MIDFSSLLLDPIWGALGVPAVLTLRDNRTFAITVLDKTAGVSDTAIRTEVPTVTPAAAIRYSELVSLGLNADDIVHGTLAFNAFTWTIKNRRLDPNPSGERAGEVIAMLADQTELASSES